MFSKGGGQPASIGKERKLWICGGSGFVSPILAKREGGRRLREERIEGDEMGTVSVCKEGEVVAEGRIKKEQRLEGAAALLGEDERLFFRVFCVALKCFCFKIAPPFCVLETHIYRQNNVWSSNMVPQLFFFFVNFDFS